MAEAEIIEGGMFGRKEILTSVDKITKENVASVLSKALMVHNTNSVAIDYLYRYMRGEQPILSRKKDVRPEICNRVVENHASEIVQFTSGYFLGEPVTYVRRGDSNASSEEINELNDFMFYEDKASHDKDMATWLAICGVAYRMVLPDKDSVSSPDQSPFELDTPDPRHTFVVYHSGFGHKRIMGVREITRTLGKESTETLYCGYTKDHYFEVANGVVRKWEAHTLGDIPIFEYRLNMARMGSFEPALPLLDAINTVASNRLDGVELFVQSFVKFVNCDITADDFKELKDLGAIKIKSVDGQTADVEILSQELNQEQTQTLVDYLYQQVLTICGMPTTTKGGSSTSDTGAAVFLRDGWSQCEARARDTELLFKKSEKEFLRLVLTIIRTSKEFNLSLAEIECKFTRRQHDNLLVKSQALLQLLEAGFEPSLAIATVGLVNDPMDVAKQSELYLEKWKPKPTAPTDNSGDKSLEISVSEKTPKTNANGRETENHKNTERTDQTQEE